jgi:hypothetical protein
MKKQTCEVFMVGSTLALLPNFRLAGVIQPFSGSKSLGISISSKLNAFRFGMIFLRMDFKPEAGIFC